MTSHPSRDIELAHSLVSELSPHPESPAEQIAQESDLEEMARSDLSPAAYQIVMGGIYGRARRRHPSAIPADRAVIDLRDAPDERGEAEATVLTSVPEGFRSEEILPIGARLDSRQFKGSVFSFADSEPVITADVRELMTESGKLVHICDLRTLMTKQVQKLGPKDEKLARLLEKDFLYDVVKQADNGRGGKPVKTRTKVHYSSRGGTKVRAYWMMVRDENNPSVLTVARLADCDDSTALQEDLYRRVLNTNM